MTDVTPATPEWNIAQLERHLSDGAVFTAHWTVNLQDQGESAGCYGSIGFTVTEDPENFIPYEDLTKEIVVGWVQDAMGEEQVAGIATALAAQIEQKLHPTNAQGIPWNN